MSSKERKIYYMGGLILLLIPIVFLGAPPGKESGSGGKIAQQRERYELGESTLGEVDPASSTMSLVLLGFRGLAATSLHMQAEEEKKTKNFAQLRQTVDSITLLQPHFKKIWEFQAWTLSYNCSAECDDVADRWYWLKEGMKFLQKGVARNQKVPELYFSTGEYMGHKVGTADEKVYYRRFFKEDPRLDVYKGGPDLTINPERLDNFLVAEKWHRQANAVLERPNVEQHRMEECLFVAYPYHSQRSYAEFMYEDMLYEMKQVAAQNLSDDERSERFGAIATKYDTQTGDAWKHALQQWVDEYGRREFDTPGGKIFFAATEEDLKKLCKEDGNTYEDKFRWHDSYIGRTGYTRYREKATYEQREELIHARRELAEAKLNWREFQNYTRSKELHKQGLEKIAAIYKEHPALVWDDENLREIAFKGTMIYESLLQNDGESLPADFAMNEWWNSPDYAPYREDLKDQFQRQFGN